MHIVYVYNNHCISTYVPKIMTSLQQLARAQIMMSLGYHTAYSNTIDTAVAEQCA
jgi:uncharacterized protein YijF (DUF1287 family)